MTSTASRINVWPVASNSWANQNYRGAMPDRDDAVIECIVQQMKVMREIKKARQALAELEALENELANRLGELT